MVKNVVEAMPKTVKSGTTEYRAGIRDGMGGPEDFVAAEGVYTMSDKDHNGVDARAQVLVEVENGRYQLVQ
ncbi:MAG: hypothetical protein ABI277_19450 [Burkholderiaceae bacterium]